MSWPPSSLLEVRELDGRGRGLVAACDIAAGTPILCEAALASANLVGCNTDQPWLVAAELAAVLLRGPADVLAQTDALEPRDLRAAMAILSPEEAAEVETALAHLQSLTPDGCCDDVKRRLLHVVVRNALELDRCQALCARASLINHSCTPNATFLAFRRTYDGALCCCIRAVEAICPGEEVCISYVADLAAPVFERAAALAHYHVNPVTRPCDAALEAWAPAAPPLGDERRAQLERELGARNSAADEAWTAAQRGIGGDAAMQSAARTALMGAAAHYAKLLQLASGNLGESHALVLQARQRLAHVMMLSGVQRSQANALPVWRAVLAATRMCVPKHWPALLEPLRGATAAAKAAGDEEAAAAYKAETDALLALLNPSCTDCTAG